MTAIATEFEQVPLLFLIPWIFFLIITKKRYCSNETQEYDL